MMAKENLAEMPENYDMMDEVKASAVMNETEEQKIVASNVNDNQEGENPPSPKGGAATKAVEENTVNENARDISQPLTVEDIVKSKQLSPEMLAEIYQPELWLCQSRLQLKQIKINIIRDLNIQSLYWTISKRRKLKL